MIDLPRRAPAGSRPSRRPSRLTRWAALAALAAAGCQDSAPQPPPATAAGSTPVSSSPRQKAGSLSERRELREKEQAAGKP
jgi:hypothetical protein